MNKKRLNLALFVTLVTFNIAAYADVILLDPAPLPATFTAARAEAQGFDQGGNVRGVCIYTKRVYVGGRAGGYRTLFTGDFCTWDLAGNLLSADACSYGYDCRSLVPTNAADPGPVLIAANSAGVQVGWRWRVDCPHTGTLTLPSTCDPVAIEQGADGSVLDLPFDPWTFSYAFGIDDSSNVVVGAVGAQGFIYKP